MLAISKTVALVGPAEATAPSALRLREGAPELRHAADPAFVIVGLFPHVTKNLRMREDEEPLFREAVYDALRHILGRQHAINMLRTLPARTQHRGVDRLRAEDRYADALIAMGNRENFRETHGRVFRDPVHGIADLVEQGGSGDRVEKGPPSARNR